MRSKDTDVITPGLVPRLDEYEVKRGMVNYIIEDLCKEQRFRYIENSNIDPTRHLNASELHLNKSGAGLLTVNLFNGSRQRLENAIHKINEKGFKKENEAEIEAGTDTILWPCSLIILRVWFVCGGGGRD